MTILRTRPVLLGTAIMALLFIGGCADAPPSAPAVPPPHYSPGMGASSSPHPVPPPYITITKIKKTDTNPLVLFLVSNTTPWDIFLAKDPEGTASTIHVVSYLKDGKIEYDEVIPSATFLESISGSDGDHEIALTGTDFSNPNFAYAEVRIQFYCENTVGGSTKGGWVTADYKYP